MNNESCKSCVYIKREYQPEWTSSNNNGFSEWRAEQTFCHCHRYPEKVPVNENHWCGEYDYDFTYEYR